MILRNTLSLVIACLLLWNGANAFNIAFRVDMNNVTANFITPQVNGTFNNWCGACFSMTDADGDNIWEGTTNLAAVAGEIMNGFITPTNQIIFLFPRVH